MKSQVFASHFCVFSILLLQLSVASPIPENQSEKGQVKPEADVAQVAPSEDVIQQQQVMSEAEAASLAKFLNVILGDIADNNLVKCFQRLVCVISAQPQNFPKNVSIVDGVKVSQLVTLDDKAGPVSKVLRQALEYGVGSTIESCEKEYDQCQWTGDQMDDIIRQYQVQANSATEPSTDPVFL